MKAAEESTQTRRQVNERILRLRRKYRDEVPEISAERAQFFTDSWLETQDKGYSNVRRVALAMKNVFENMTHYVDPDDHIAGYWTEFFLGMPIDIERGVFNKVLESELDRKDMINFRVRSIAGTMSYLIKKRSLTDFIQNVKMTKRMGPQPMDLGFDTMTEREINKYKISPAAKRRLKKDLLPKWRGKTVVDKVEKKVLGSELLSGDMKDFNKGIPANTSRQTFMITPCSTIASYQAHVIIDFEKILKLGLNGMKAEVEERLASTENLSGEQVDFLESLIISLDGVAIYATRLADKIEEKLAAETNPERKVELGRMLEICRRVPFEPAAGFREAVQSSWTVKTAVELAHPVNLHCLGRMDLIYYPYYEKDLAEGKITRDEARDLFSELLLKMMSQNIRPESNILSNFYHRYLGSAPVTIGGVTPDGVDGTNDLTYLFIEAADDSRAITNVSLRVHKDTPDELYEVVADVLRNGSSNLSLFNDDVNVEAMMRRGFTERDARDYAIMGCVEMLCPGKTGGMSACALLLSRLLDITLRNGDSQTLLSRLHDVGLKTGDPDTFKNFDEFVDAFLAQASHQIELIVNASDMKDEMFARHMPAPLISSFIEGCLDSGKDVTSGGGVYDLSGISYINSIANLVDSMLVIRKLIFEEKSATFKELIEALDSNFEGHEELLKKINSIQGKWGNGHKDGDELCSYISKKLFDESYKYTSFRGGPYVPYMISMITHTIDGRVSIASPDGRRAAQPYAASCNPYNVEKSGVTGVMKSLTAIDFRDVLGCAVNVKFHPSAIGSDAETQKKWISLMRTYFAMGGQQIQPTVASADMLRDAQDNPAEYKDLIVKVGGYSTYFVDLGKEIQEEIIARTEHNFVN